MGSWCGSIRYFFLAEFLFVCGSYVDNQQFTSLRYVIWMDNSQKNYHVYIAKITLMLSNYIMGEKRVGLTVIGGLYLWNILTAGLKDISQKNKQVFDVPPPEVHGRILLDQLRDFGAERTPDCGGNGHHPVDGACEYHNWHKKSIFWDLPYWKDHLLRHCLDVMHVEKNFFDNIMNTV